MILKGTPVSGGMAVAEVLCIAPMRAVDMEERSSVPPVEAKNNLGQVVRALSNEMSTAAGELRALGKASLAEMMEMQRTMLQDELLLESVARHLDRGYSLSAAIMRGAEEQQELLRGTGDAFLMERIPDVADVAARMVCCANGEPFPSLGNLRRPVIAVAKDLQPSMLMVGDTSFLKGILLESGSRTSHISILAANMEIPTVVDCRELDALLTYLTANGDAYPTIYLDAEQGEVCFGLTDSELLAAKARTEAHFKEKRQLLIFCDKDCVTADGRRIYLYGNIMETTAIDRLMNYGVDGVGLFRTEFLYMNRLTLPTEDEQFALYQAAARKLKGKPLTIRTMDIGADKPVQALALEEEQNPFLGFRAIRVCLAMPELLRTQLRAILRASAQGNVKIMFPMIATMGELEQALAILEEAKAELRDKGIPFDQQISTGIMVEVPSAAILAHQFIRKVDFFSIGSNDLTQYTLAVDRMNRKVQHLYNGTDPAVLALIRNSIDACRATPEKSCSLCGEMASDPAALPTLIGLGLQHISVNPSAVLPLKRLVSTLCYEELRKSVGREMNWDDGN